MESIFTNELYNNAIKVQGRWRRSDQLIVEEMMGRTWN